MSQFGLAITLTALLAGAAADASPDPKDLAIPPAEQAKARDLVGKLASENFDEREDAQDDLGKMGRLALPALLDGLANHPSPEVRFRCQTLLPQAASLDLKARLDTFLADTGGKFEHDMPGWNEFRKLTGGGPTARAVFVDLLADQGNRDLVLGVGGQPSELGKAVAARKQEMYYWRFPRPVNGRPRVAKTATAADVLALMFAESQAEAKYVPRTVSSTVVYAANDFTAAAADAGEKGKVYRAVVRGWVESREDALSLNLAISTATNLNMTAEAARAAGRLVTLKGATAFYRAQAAMTVARLGAKDQLPALEKAFADESVLRTFRVAPAGNQEVIQVQLRDIALVAALLLTGQDPGDYGFTATNKAEGMRLSYSNWRVAEEKRKAAFEKWAAWRAKHPDVGKAAEPNKDK